MIEISKDKYDASKHLLDFAAGDKTFAYSIIENRQGGKVYVDNEIDIKSAIFWHDCGYGLLAEGALSDDSATTVVNLFNEKHPSSGKGLVLQVLGSDLKNKIEQERKKDQSIRAGTRLIFRFNRSRFFEEFFKTPVGFSILQIDGQLYQRIKGNVVPAFSWASPEEFINNGIGFCLMKEEEIRSVGFSCFIGNGQIDIGVETIPKYRKHGYAKIIASKLIKYCLDNNLEPIWGCSKENISSKKIAMLLGFELVGENMYYYKLHR